MAYYNIKSLENLSRDQNQSNFYDLFVQHYAALSPDVTMRMYIVDRRRAMRLDLVCSDLYSNISNLALLMFINNVDNPFGINEGDIIFWLESKDLSKANYVDAKTIQDGRDSLINALKISVSDPARAAYLANRGNDNLPPNVLATDAPKILVNNNKIVVGANLFNNPNNQTRNVDAINTTSSLGTLTAANGNTVTPTTPPTLTNAELTDNTQRILVRRFIETGNTTIDTSATSSASTP